LYFPASILILQVLSHYQQRSESIAYATLWDYAFTLFWQSGLPVTILWWRGLGYGHLSELRWSLHKRAKKSSNEREVEGQVLYVTWPEIQRHVFYSWHSCWTTSR